MSSCLINNSPWILTGISNLACPKPKPRLPLIPAPPQYSPTEVNNNPTLLAVKVKSFKSYWLLSFFHIYTQSVVQLLSYVQLFVTPWIAAHQASLSITNSWSLLKLMSIESVMPSNHLVLCHLVLLCLQSFPASGSFPVSQLFASGGQSIAASASASVLPMNIQGWIPLGWTGWISTQSKGLSRVFSNTTVQKHQFFSTTINPIGNSFWLHLEPHHLSPLPLLPPVPAPSTSALGCCSSLLTGPLLPLLLNIGFQHSGHGDPLNTFQIISLPYWLPIVLHDIFRPPARFCLPYSILVTWHFTDLAMHRSIRGSLHLDALPLPRMFFPQMSACIIPSAPSNLHSNGTLPVKPFLATQFQMAPSPTHHRCVPCPPVLPDSTHSTHHLVTLHFLYCLILSPLTLECRVYGTKDFLPVLFSVLSMRHRTVPSIQWVFNKYSLNKWIKVQNQLVNSE